MLSKPRAHSQDPTVSPVTRERADLTPPAPLPVPIASLVGRDHEVDQVRTILLRDDVRLVTLTGPGGVGKSRLALAAAMALQPEFADGVRLMRLAAIADAELVLPTIAANLGLPGANGQDALTALQIGLYDRELLLLLDNFEQVVTAGANLADLLRGCPRLKALVTSRARLRVRGEHVIPVMPLPVPADRLVADPETILAYPAVELFVQRGREIRPDLFQPAGDLDAVVGICRRLGGLPLAIELAAARVDILPPPMLLERLQPALPLLVGGPRDLPDRLRTMRDAIGWSYDLLSPEEQALFRRLAVFAGGFTLEAAESVAAAEALGIAGIDGLAALVDASLLGREETPGANTGARPRYALLEPVREFGLEALEANRETATVRASQAAYYLAFAEQSEWDLARGQAGRWLDPLAVEQDNLRAALTWFEHVGEPEDFLRLARALWVLWLFRGPYGEGRAWLERALARGADAPAPLRRQALFGLGLLAVNQGDAARAEACFRDSLAIAQAHHDAEGIVQGWHGLGELAMHRRQFAQATQHFEEALAWTRRLADRVLAGVNCGVALAYLGACAYAMDDMPLAAARFEEALREQRAVDDRWGIGFSLVGAAFVARDQGQDEQALTLFVEGLTLFSDLGDRRMIALALDGIAGLAGSWQQAERAARLYGAAAAVQQASGLPVEPAYHAAHERGVAATRASLGDEAFTAAWTAGAALPLDQAVAEAATVADLSPRARSVSRKATPFGLTPRELEVLRLVGDGRSDKEIGEALFISHRTAMNHVARILAKLDVSSRALAAREASRHGLL
jgi:predicted ATPase/DNA-binding CsgD family transcriptional regulator